MNQISSHPCNYQDDIEQLLAFWLTCRAAMDVRLYPTIWRIRLLLTSRVWEPDKDTRIWRDSGGKIIAFSMIWRRLPTSPYLVFDVFSYPSLANQALLYDILHWGSKRMREIAKGLSISPKAYVNGLPLYPFSEVLLNDFGYTCSQPDPAEYSLYFGKPLVDQENIELPPNYAIGSIQDPEQLESYQAVYGFTEVNPLHLREQLESDEYSHLVVVDLDGVFVAYSECSIWRAEWQITNQRIGWIDYVGTKPEEQGKGLGQAILSASLMQLKQWGADTAMLVTVNTNTPAVNLYKKMGFSNLEVIQPKVYEKLLTLDDPVSLKRSE